MKMQDKSGGGSGGGRPETISHRNAGGGAGEGAIESDLNLLGIPAVKADGIEIGSQQMAGEPTR